MRSLTLLAILAFVAVSFVAASPLIQPRDEEIVGDMAPEAQRVHIDWGGFLGTHGMRPKLHPRNLEIAEDEEIVGDMIPEPLRKKWWKYVDWGGFLGTHGTGPKFRPRDLETTEEEDFVKPEAYRRLRFPHFWGLGPVVVRPRSEATVEENNPVEIEEQRHRLRLPYHFWGHGPVIVHPRSEELSQENNPVEIEEQRLRLPYHFWGVGPVIVHPRSVEEAEEEVDGVMTPEALKKHWYKSVNWGGFLFPPRSLDIPQESNPVEVEEQRLRFHRFWGHGPVIHPWNRFSAVEEPEKIQPIAETPEKIQPFAEAPEKIQPIAENAEEVAPEAQRNFRTRWPIHGGHGPVVHPWMRR
ncbi:hypothetical protein KR026_005752 [Drosophila bipectinata]|nr:hypothetical protein KR026_005752 [Drosophila bipectinata]